MWCCLLCVFVVCLIFGGCCYLLLCACKFCLWSVCEVVCFVVLLCVVFLCVFVFTCLVVICCVLLYGLCSVFA